MSNIKFSLYEYDLPLIAPLRLKGGGIHSRQGLVVVGENDKGGFASGEIAPLPVFSTETLPIAKEEAITVARSTNEGKNHAIESLQRAARSVAFGFDSVIRKLNRDEPKPLRNEIRVNALLSGDPADILSQALCKKAKGFRSLKLKIGSLPIDETIELVKNLRQTVGDQCEIRLDANRSLSVAQTLRLADELVDIGIEYFEEPVQSITELKRLIGDASNVRLALDESLADAANDILFQGPQVTTLVIKPTILGPSRTRYLIDLANKFYKKIVISSSFESPIGISHLVRMAASFEHDIPSGLDTLSIFADNPFGCGDWIKNGRIKIDDLPESFDLSASQYRKLV